MRLRAASKIRSNRSFARACVGILRTEVLLEDAETAGIRELHLYREDFCLILII